MLPLDCGQEFDPAGEEEFFAALPPRPAVFLLELRPVSGASGGAERPSGRPYLRRTADLRRSCERLLRVPEPSAAGGPSPPTKRLNLREVAARVRYRLTGSTFEQAWVLYQQAQEHFPRRYRELLRLRPPALLKINLANRYPRCYVTRRILSDGGFYFGPFRTRKSAEAFTQEFLNLFKIRRCQIKIRRDPAFPGCIYSEMKMCLAPCFAGCSKEEYDIEVGRVAGFLASGGASLTSELERGREAASEALDFERASAAHKKHEKVLGVLRDLPELPRRIDELDALILEPAAEPDTIAVFTIHGGWISDPFPLRFGELAIPQSGTRSVEEILREQLAAQAAPSDSRDESARSSGPREQLADHLSLLARWFYSKPRQGEIFFPQGAACSPDAGGGAALPASRADWPYRRIIRACARLLGAQSSLPFPAQQP